MPKPIRGTKAKISIRSEDGQWLEIGEVDLVERECGIERKPDYRPYIPGLRDFAVTVRRWPFGPLDMPPPGSDPGLS